MNNRNYDCIIIISVISGLFITTCDYLVQMKTVETDYFVSRLLSLEETILNLSSFGCIFTFPFWILGTYFIYTTMCKVNKKLALINTFCISYSLLMLGFYHYSYAIIYSIGTSKMIMQTNIDWQLLTGSNIPFFPFMFILLPVTWLIVGFSNFSSKAIVPRWSIVVNPVILTIILSIVTWIIPKTECLRLSSITSAHQILVFKEGCLVQKGRHDELHVTTGIYKNMWNAYINAHNWKLNLKK